MGLARKDDEERVRVGGWILSKWEHGWTALRVGPVAGFKYIVIEISGRPPWSCGLDWWISICRREAGGYFTLRRLEKSDCSAVMPLSHKERQELEAKLMHSRPGPSGLKLVYLRFYPPWIQDLFWRLLDAQRMSAMVSDVLRREVQVNIRYREYLLADILHFGTDLLHRDPPATLLFFTFLRVPCNNFIQFLLKFDPWRCLRSGLCGALPVLYQSQAGCWWDLPWQVPWG